MRVIFCMVSALLMVILMLCEGMLFAVAVGVIIGIAVGFVFLLTFCICKHRSLHPAVS